MEQLAGVLLALGTAWIGEVRENRIFTLASAGLFLWIGFDSTEPLILLAMASIGIYQLYKTFMK